MLPDRRQKELAEYYAVLKRIAAYQRPERLRKFAERQYGLSYEEALEMAYDNVISEAATAVRGKRTPK